MQESRLYKSSTAANYDLNLHKKEVMASVLLLNTHIACNSINITVVLWDRENTKSSN